jgi:hypothetical protein
LYNEGEEMNVEKKPVLKEAEEQQAPETIGI